MAGCFVFAYFGFDCAGFAILHGGRWLGFLWFGVLRGFGGGRFVPG